MSALAATEADIARFMSYVDKLPNGCWFWTGGRSRGGGNRKWYGSFHLNGKTIRAHRFSCEVLGKKGPLPPGQDRDHECVFSLCVNHEHLEYVPKRRNTELRDERRRTKLAYLALCYSGEAPAQPHIMAQAGY